MQKGDKVTVIGVWKPAYVKVVGEEQSVLTWRNTDKDFPSETVEINRYIIPWDQGEEQRKAWEALHGPLPHETYYDEKPRELRAPALKELYS